MTGKLDIKEKLISKGISNIPDNPTFQNLVDAIDNGINNNSIKDAINGSDGNLITIPNPTSDQIVEGINFAKNNLINTIHSLNPSIQILKDPSIDFSNYIYDLNNSLENKVLKIEFFTESKNWICPAGVTQITIVAINGGHNGSLGDFINGNHQGGAGGEIKRKNSFNTIPGKSYSIIVGASGNNNKSNFDNISDDEYDEIQAGGIGGAYRRWSFSHLATIITYNFNFGSKIKNDTILGIVQGKFSPGGQVATSNQSNSAPDLIGNDLFEDTRSNIGCGGLGRYYDDRPESQVIGNAGGLYLIYKI